MPVSASGDSAARSSIASRTSSSQSRSSGANETSPASSASSASNGPSCASASATLLRLAEKPRLEARQPVAHRIRAAVHLRQRDRVRPIRDRSACRCDRHASASSNSVPAKALPGLDEREEAPRREIDPLQRPLDQLDDLAHQPVVAVRGERPIDGEHRLGISCRLARRWCRSPARSSAAAESRRRARGTRAAARTGRRQRGSPLASPASSRPGACDRELRRARVARSIVTETALYAHRVSDHGRIERAERDAGPRRRTIRLRRQLARAPVDFLLEAARRDTRHPRGATRPRACPSRLRRPC